MRTCCIKEKKKNPPFNAGDMGLTPGRGTKIPQAVPCGINK